MVVIVVVPLFLPLVYGTGDVGRWCSCCVSVGAVFMAGVRRHSICGCNVVLLWPARVSTWWLICVYTHINDLRREVGEVKYR